MTLFIIMIVLVLVLLQINFWSNNLRLYQYRSYLELEAMVSHINDLGRLRGWDAFVFTIGFGFALFLNGLGALICLVLGIFHLFNFLMISAYCKNLVQYMVNTFPKEKIESMMK